MTAKGLTLLTESSVTVTVEQSPYRVSRQTVHAIAANGLALVYTCFMSGFPIERAFGVGFSDPGNYLWNFDLISL